jgi:hypothetical protein
MNFNAWRVRESDHIRKAEKTLAHS